MWPSLSHGSTWYEAIFHTQGAMLNDSDTKKNLAWRREWRKSVPILVGRSSRVVANCISIYKPDLSHTLSCQWLFTTARILCFIVHWPSGRDWRTAREDSYGEEKRKDSKKDDFWKLAASLATGYHRCLSFNWSGRCAAFILFISRRISPSQRVWANDQKNEQFFWPFARVYNGYTSKASPVCWRWNNWLRDC